MASCSYNDDERCTTDIAPISGPDQTFNLGKMLKELENEMEAAKFAIAWSDDEDEDDYDFCYETADEGDDAILDPSYCTYVSRTPSMTSIDSTYDRMEHDEDASDADADEGESPHAPNKFFDV